jgi:NAD-dependent dihydropyrimidine dehydrogenase PreA subunit
MEASVKEQDIEAPEITVREAWCKGCNYCVEFCPKDVLSIEDAVPVAVHLERCTGCGLCVWMCPDFAIKVRKPQKP